MKNIGTFILSHFKVRKIERGKKGRGLSHTHLIYSFKIITGTKTADEKRFNLKKKKQNTEKISAFLSYFTEMNRVFFREDSVSRDAYVRSC